MSIRAITPPEQIEDAVQTVARTVIARLADPEAVAELWESFPEIDRRDWAEVVAVVGRWGTLNEPSLTQFSRAYGLLVTVAEGGAA